MRSRKNKRIVIRYLASLLTLTAAPIAAEAAESQELLSSENDLGKNTLSAAENSLSIPGKSYIITKKLPRYEHGYSYIIDPKERAAFAAKEAKKYANDKANILPEKSASSTPQYSSRNENSAANTKNTNDSLKNDQISEEKKENAHTSDEIKATPKTNDRVKERAKIYRAAKAGKITPPFPALVSRRNVEDTSEKNKPRHRHPKAIEKAAESTAKNSQAGTNALKKSAVDTMPPAISDVQKQDFLKSQKKDEKKPPLLPPLVIPEPEGRPIPIWAPDALSEILYVHKISTGSQPLAALDRKEFTAYLIKALTATDAADRLAWENAVQCAEQDIIADEVNHRLLTARHNDLMRKYNRISQKLDAVNGKMVKIVADSEGRTAYERELKKWKRDKTRDLPPPVPIKMPAEIKAELKPLEEEQRELSLELGRLAARIGSSELRLSTTKEKLENAKKRREYIETHLNEQRSENVQLVLPGFSTELLEKENALRDEFADELRQQGFFDDEVARHRAEYPLLTDPEIIERFRLDGELLLDTRNNIIQEGLTIPRSRSRLRLRLYPDYNIDGNWHAKAMVESEIDLGHGHADGKPDIDRYWLEGNWGEAHILAGVFGLYLGEGNIYDSRYEGARVIIGDPVQYSIIGGQTRHFHDLFGAEATYIDRHHDTWGLGAYTMNSNFDRRRLIVMGKYWHPLGHGFHAGIMALYGKESGSSARGFDKHTGFVATLRHGQENAWKKGAFSWYIKYYYQPRATYISHTMNGMADYLNGFKGPGLGATYTLSKNVMLLGEIDDLRDIVHGHHNLTIWGGISWYFTTHREK